MIWILSSYQNTKVCGPTVGLFDGLARGLHFRLLKELFNQLEAIFGPQANKADDTVEGIMERLKASDAPFAKSALQNMARASPLSLKVCGTMESLCLVFIVLTRRSSQQLTLKQLREGATLSLLDCFKMEFRIVSVRRFSSVICTRSHLTA